MVLLQSRKICIVSGPAIRVDPDGTYVSLAAVYIYVCVCVCVTLSGKAGDYMDGASQRCLWRIKLHIRTYNWWYFEQVSDEKSQGQAMQAHPWKSVAVNFLAPCTG